VVTYTLEEVFQNSTSFLVNETRDTLDTATTSETANSRLGDALNVVSQNFTMALGTSFSETLATLSTAGYEEPMSERELTGREICTDTLLDYWIEKLDVCLCVCGEQELLGKCAVIIGKRT
jgi:hypothetical protein